MIVKGFITRINPDNLTAEVKTIQGEVLKKTLILFPYGFYSKPTINNNSEVLIFYALGSKYNSFCIPYNAILRDLETLENDEVRISNPNKKNRITLKQNGDIEIETEENLIETMKNLNITAAENVVIQANAINLADASANVLNQNATLQVNIPGGSSAGTYQVQIVNPGQNKVKA